jgi:hypothetical protein
VCQDSTDIISLLGCRKRRLNQSSKRLKLNITLANLTVQKVKHNYDFLWHLIELGGPAISALSVRSRKRSDVRKDQSLDGWPKFIISLAPTPVSIRVAVRQADDRNNNGRIIITT